jgi:phage tail protein X
MSFYIAKEGDRLDTVAYKYYGTLDCWFIVLAANKHLLHKEKLDADDKVNLPEWSPPATAETRALW